jgi:5-methylcytosine-specific restriction endonuclease McrBC regulatory subunit McrC
MTEETTEVTVSEDKFNGTSTMIVEKVENKKVAESFARRFWKEEYDTRPSRIVVEKQKSALTHDRYIVMVADHSSGSLKDSKTYEVEE